MTEKMPFKPCDLIIIFIAAALIFFSAFSIYVKPQSSAEVLIRGENREWVFPLETEETVIVPGPLGNTVIKIHNNEVWVESSPCKNQVCVAAGHVQRQGAWVACLPNNVLFVIEGYPTTENDEERLDAYAW